MFIVQIAAFLIMIIFLAWKCKEDVVTTLPLGVSILIFCLYILAFFKCLSGSDYLAVCILAITVIAFLKASSSRRKELLQFAGKQLISPVMLTVFIMLLLVTACVSLKVTSWWDDYNFWTTDVKGLFYLDGFAGKYRNVAPEFGDYPPAIQLFKWWFLHFSPKQFREGLMFAGYYTMNLCFLFPLLKWIKRKNPLTMMAGGVLLWVFPAVTEAFWCDGTCADLTMALVYGAFLVAVVDRQSHNPWFYYGRQGLFLMVLVLCKNTGVIWVGMGLLFSYGYQMLVQHQEKADKMLKKQNRRRLLLVTMMPVSAELSWLLFCLLRHRVARLTGTTVHMITGSQGIPAYQPKIVATFLEAFLKWPLHRWRTIGIDLSPLVCYLLILLFVLLLFRFHILDKGKTIFLATFMGLSGILFYGLNLCSHLTLFALETQYLEPFGMVSSIERYGAPFTIGSLYLILYLYLKNAKSDRVFWICLLLVLTTTDLNSAWRALYGYRNTVQEELARRDEIIDAQAEDFLEAVGANQPGKTGRILYLRDIADISWVRNTYLGFEAAPLSVMYGNIDVATAGSQDIVLAIKNAHADFLYADKLEGDGQPIFDSLTEENFVYSCLYQVTYDEQGMKLIK